MVNKELFDKTVAILVKAYQNDTLQHENCYACAIGNIVAITNGKNVNRLESGELTWDKGKPDWPAIHSFCNGAQYFNQRSWGNTEIGQVQLFNTGYTTEETATIEFAFEKEFINSNDKDGFLGLMSVIDTLMLIHEATETEAQEAKELFVKV